MPLKTYGICPWRIYDLIKRQVRYLWNKTQGSFREWLESTDGSHTIVCKMGTVRRRSPLLGKFCPTTWLSASFSSSGFTKGPPGDLCQVNKPAHSLYEGWPHLSKVIWSKCLYVEKSRRRELEIHLLQYEKELFQWQNWVPFSFHFIPFYST